MPNWSQEDVERATKRNPGITVKGAGTNPATQPVTRPRALAKAKAEDQDTGRFLVRICSVRKRLADPDGVVGKYHLDALRYAGILNDDTAALLDYEVTQRKAKKGEEEATEITVFRLNDPVTEVSKET